MEPPPRTRPAVKPHTTTPATRRIVVFLFSLSIARASLLPGGHFLGTRRLARGGMGLLRLHRGRLRRADRVGRDRHRRLDGLIELVLLLALVAIRRDAREREIAHVHDAAHVGEPRDEVA